MNVNIDMVQFLNDLRNSKPVLCPECRKGYFVPIGEAEAAHCFYCSECNARVHID